MLILSISAVYLTGMLIYLIFRSVFRRKQISGFYTGCIYWLVLLFSALSGLTLSFSAKAVSLEEFFQNLLSINAIGMISIVCVIVLLCEFISPNRFNKISITEEKFDTPVNEREQNRFFAEKEYEGFLTIICNVVVAILMLCSIFYLLYDFLSLNQSVNLIKDGIVSIIGILQIIILPVCIRQVLYYLYRIKRLKADTLLLKHIDKINAARRYLENKNKYL